MLKNEIELANTIRKIRREKGISQEYIASQLQLSQQAYQKIENCTTRINIDHLTKIATALEIDLHKLVQPEANGNKLRPTERDINDTLTLLQHQSEEIIYLRKQNERMLGLIESSKSV